MAVPVPVIASYITGHGIGHALRHVEVLQTLGHQWPGCRFVLRTMVPRDFLERHLTGLQVEIAPAELDAGMVERDFFRQHPEATLERLDALAAQRHAIIAREVAALATHRPTLVLADIPPLAGPIAARLGVPAVGIANFGWNFIYKGFLQAHPGFAPHIEQIQNDYSSFTHLFRLPLSEPLEAFPHASDVGLLARRSRRSRRSAREALGLPGDSSRRLVVVVFRHAGPAPEALQALGEADGGHTQYLVGGPVPVELPHWRAIPPSWAHEFADLLAAADAVIAKPGYGIVADCLANGTPLLHVPRHDFAEVPHLIAGIDAARLPQRAITEDAFMQAAWASQLESLLASPRGEPVAANGALHIARGLEEMLARKGMPSAPCIPA